MLFSIALSMVGAWLYRYPGWLLTTLLTIPYHYILLIYSSDDPTLWKEALNPFGISTQLFISGFIALLTSAKDKLDQVNSLLEKKVTLRTRELNRLRHYIIENHEAAQVIISKMMLEDIGKPLSEMLKESEILTARLRAADMAEATKAARLNQLIQESINLIENLEFIDSYIINDHHDFAYSVQILTDNFLETAGTQFELDLGDTHQHIPQELQYQLYRITYEAVANAVRHAKADRIQISLKHQENTYCLTVVNSGPPMPAQPVMGLGLKLMQHRAQQIGGQINWSTTPEGQTCLQCTVTPPVD
jgi:signal transduction histidine kinase